MALGGDIMDFVTRFQSLQLQRDSSDELIKDLLIYCERVESGLRQENQRLTDRLNDAQLDLVDATKSRRDFQQRLQHAEARMGYISQDNDNLKNRNPYVLVLIDGDGLIFQEGLIRQGIEGGKKAAYALRSAVAEQCGDHANEVEIVAKVCANLTGLGKAMRRDGSLDSESDLKDFTLGFTQAKASFDYVDVGHGKERADSKIKESTRWNLRNYNCKQILLGVSHDAGYAPFLDEILQDENTRRRITVIEGFPTVKELQRTGVNILNLNDKIFRNEKLQDRGMGSYAVSAPPAPFVLTPSTSIASIATPPTSVSYAGVISSASPPPQITLPLAPKTANALVRVISHTKPPAWNPGQRGTDPSVAVNQVALEAIKKRKDSSKLCNNHYLRGPCAKGDGCCFEHKYKPSNDEINAIAFLARLNPCTNGQDCEVEDCIYGHHCPSVRDGVCVHPYCKFRIDEHPPNTKFKNAKIYEN